MLKMRGLPERGLAGCSPSTEARAVQLRWRAARPAPQVAAPAAVFRFESKEQPDQNAGARPYLSGARVSSAPRVELLLRPPGCGGAWARVGRIVCVRAPSLTSVRDSRVGSGAGDKMFDGVTLVGEALRPLSLSGPFTRTCRQDDAGSRPRCIGVMKGVLARVRDRLDVGCAGHWAGAGCSIAEPKPGSSGQLIRWLGGGGRLEPADAAA